MKREERMEEDVYIICMYTYMNVYIKYNISLTGEERYEWVAPKKSQNMKT